MYIRMHVVTAFTESHNENFYPLLYLLCACGVFNKTCLHTQLNCGCKPTNALCLAHAAYKAIMGLYALRITL